MILLPLLCSLPILGVGDGHAALHPADASFFVEVPDFPRLMQAYTGSPLLQFLADEELQTLAAKIAGEDPDSFEVQERVVEEALEAIGNLPSQVTQALGLLGEARTMSLSVSVPELHDLLVGLDQAEEPDQQLELLTSNVGVLCLMEFQNADAALNAAEMLAAVPGTRESGDTGVPPLEFGGASGVPKRLLVEGREELGYWVAAVGPTLTVGFGSSTPAQLAGRIESPSTSLASNPDFGRAVVDFAPAEGVTVYETWVHLDQISDLIRISTWELPRRERELFASVMDKVLAGDSVDVHARTRLVQGRFVGESLTLQEYVEQGLAGFLGAQPLDQQTVNMVPSNAVGAWAVRLDPDVLLEQCLELATNFVGDDLGGALLALENDYGLRPVEDLFQALGTRCAVYMLPITGLAVPQVHAVVELEDAEAFLRAMEGLGRMAEHLGEGELEVTTRPYRNVPLFTIAPKRNIGELAGEAGAPLAAATMMSNLFDPELSIAVLEDRALIGLSARHVKREVKRLLSKSKGDSSPHPIATEAYAYPADATSISYLDWGSIMGGFYSAFRTFMPMIAQAVPDLPFEPADLPSEEIFERHFKPSFAWTRNVEGGIYEYSESSFGPEVGVGAFLGGMAALLLPRLNSVVSSPGATVEPLPAPPELVDDSAERTQTTLKELKVAIFLYESEHGAHPEQLADLLTPTASYPRGLLEQEQLPKDAWGQEFVYVRDPDGGTYDLRSTGPDGLDQNGNGDDIRL